MIDFDKISSETWRFFEETGLFLREIGVSSIVPEAVAVCMWNKDCDRPPHSKPLLWQPDRGELIMHLAEQLNDLPKYDEVVETDFSPDMLKGFEVILSENDSVTMKNLSEWLVGKWLPLHYPQFFPRSVESNKPVITPELPGQLSEDNCITPSNRNLLEEESLTGETVKEYCENMLALASKGKLHRALKREDEMKELLLYLAMKTKNCPALIGKPGTGKTALAEELAFRLFLGDVPDSLRDLKLYRLDYTTIRATGQEEVIMRKIIDEAKEDTNLVLFIDEMHLLINNHPQAPNIVAQMLKPPMARGEIKIIGATTYEEYTQNIESDSAFERRFNPIHIKEPDIETTKAILRRSESRFNHGLSLSDETIYEAIKLTSKYIKNRYLPAKAIELIDQAAARIELENRGTLSLTPDDIKRELSIKTGLPLERVSQDETVFLNNLENKLHEIVIGQNLAVQAVSDAIRLRRAGVGNDDRPIGSFLFLGTTGTGKTLLSKAVSKVLFGDSKKMIRLDMSEYGEENSTTKLIGPPPGYVGYENGGALTNAVLQNPYSVVLVDELEKAHRAVHNLFLQVLDEGHLTDNHGRVVDFSNTVVIITSNICQGEILSTLPKKNVTKEDIESCSNMVKQRLKDYLPLELLNRIDKTVMFEPIAFDDALRISELLLNNKVKEFKDKQNLCLHYEPGVIDFVTRKGYSREFGARNLERTIEDQISKPLTNIMLQNLLDTNKKIFAYVESDQVKFRN